MSFIYVIFFFISLQFALGASTCLDVYQLDTKNAFWADHSFLFSPRPPSYEEILSLNLHSNFLSNKKMHPTHAFARIESYRRVLKLFEILPNPMANYFFIGNGYYPVYLMAKAMFSGTRLFDHIHFLAISRDLAKKISQEPNVLNTYLSQFSAASLETMPVVVIDSVTVNETPNMHSILRVSLAMRSYLETLGLKPDVAMKSVIALGMPESSADQSYRTTRLDSYFRLIDANNGNGELKFPYLDPQLKWTESPFYESHSPLRNKYYWTTKFTDLDSSFLPVGEVDIRPRLGTISNEERQDYIVQALTKISLYQQIIAYGLQNKKILDAEILTLNSK